MTRQIPLRTRSKDVELVKVRRDQIADGALRAFVDKGYDRTSIREIAEECGMSIGSLYHYVGSKEDILYLIIAKGFSIALDLIEKRDYELESPEEALRDAIDKYCRTIDGIQDLVVFSYHELSNLQGEPREQILDIERRVISVFEELLSAGIRKGKFKVSDVKLLANTIVVIGQMWAFRRWYLHKHYTLSEFIREQTDLVMKVVS